MMEACRSADRLCEKWGWSLAWWWSEVRGIAEGVDCPDGEVSLRLALRQNGLRTGSISFMWFQVGKQEVWCWQSALHLALSPHLSFIQTFWESEVWRATSRTSEVIGWTGPLSWNVHFAQWLDEKYEYFWYVTTLVAISWNRTPKNHMNFWTETSQVAWGLAFSLFPCPQRCSQASWGALQAKADSIEFTWFSLESPWLPSTDHSHVRSAVSLACWWYLLLLLYFKPFSGSWRLQSKVQTHQQEQQSLLCSLS